MQETISKRSKSDRGRKRSVGKPLLDFGPLQIKEFKEIEDMRKSENRLSYAQWVEKKKRAEIAQKMSVSESLQMPASSVSKMTGSRLLQKHQAIVASRRRESIGAFNMWCAVQDAALIRAMRDREQTVRQEEIQKQQARLDEIQRDTAVLESITSAIKAESNHALFQDLQARGLDVHLDSGFSNLQQGRRSVRGRQKRRSVDSGRLREVAWGVLDLQEALEAATAHTSSPVRPHRGRARDEELSELRSLGQM